MRIPDKMQPMLLGAHLSIAGGLHRALERAKGHGFDTVAMFVRNQRQWAAPELTDSAVRAFRRTRRGLGISPVVAHGSYLLNLAGGGEVWRKSIAAVREDLGRCDRLGIERLVIHPGSSWDAAAGLRRIADGLNEILSACRGAGPKVLLETTAGQGNCLGCTFEQLAEILSLLDRPGRVGVCLDTCHVFAAGYDIRTPPAYRRTMEQFDRILGLDRLSVVHVNDSLRPLGSRVDRHAHVGRGRIGRRGLANFINDPRLACVPFILETPKGTAPDGRDWDEVNATALRALVRGRAQGR